MDLHFSSYTLHPVHTLSRNTREDLVSLWIALSKCKRQLQYSLRLENMTWRLWYRQAIMNKKPVVSSPAISEPTSQELVPIVSKQPTKTLSRSRSSPTLSAQCFETAKQSSPSSPPPSSSSPSATNNKFYISDSEDEDDDYDYDYDYETTTTDDEDVSISDYPLTPAATGDDAGLFIKQEISSYQSAGSRTSMLAVMLNQQQQQQQQSDNTITSTSQKGATGLRRCDARIERLDQWFTSSRA
ncbi:hypothetical protein LRAMOSA04126 [Lichtheimia ramosa]|uniref:Nitrogen regulatory protein areA GATA-like domain-containing protein n=1 Tax=Lichtheimia ramosa TaxID=688394 RepID=A0A077WXE8_9FUNG|nr:hypothetical protein LRAMOSA04126 [Lichtheimia ramosa]